MLLVTGPNPGISALHSVHRRLYGELTTPPDEPLNILCTSPQPCLPCRCAPGTKCGIRSSSGTGHTA